MLWVGFVSNLHGLPMACVAMGQVAVADVVLAHQRLAELPAVALVLPVHVGHRVPWAQARCSRRAMEGKMVTGDAGSAFSRGKNCAEFSTAVHPSSVWTV